MSKRSPTIAAASPCRCCGTKSGAQSSTTRAPTSSACSTRRSTRSAPSPATIIRQDFATRSTSSTHKIYATVNNGVYRCGFAATQEAYDEAVAALFRTLDELEARLATRRFLFGEALTEADWRLFVTLLRFDPVYVGLFKCNIRRIEDYPNLRRYRNELRAWPGVEETVDLMHIKRHYYESLRFINPTGIVPAGPA